MQILHGIEQLGDLPPGCVLSVGNYDGLHRGHTRLLQVAGQLARDRGAALAVVTFEPHPLTVLRPQLAPPRLTPPRCKEQLLRQLGVDFLVLLPPTQPVLDLDAEAFWHILRDQARVSHLVEGEDFTFGKQRGGTVAKLQKWIGDSPVGLHIVPPQSAALLDMHLVAVSSSLIRWLLFHGRARDAAICLGRPYRLQGTVVQGYRRGRTIGFPTANLDCGDQMIPGEGVYAARMTLDGRDRAVALSIGPMPTFGDNRYQIEGHIIDFEGDLYGQAAQMEVLDWIRPQRRYPSVSMLTEQLKADVAQCRRLMALDPARELVRARL